MHLYFFLYGRTVCIVIIYTAPYVTMKMVKYILPVALKINELVKCIPRYKALRIKMSCGAKEKNNPSIEPSERKKKMMWQTASSSSPFLTPGMCSSSWQRLRVQEIKTYGRKPETQGPEGSYVLLHFHPSGMARC